MDKILVIGLSAKGLTVTAITPFNGERQELMVVNPLIGNVVLYPDATNGHFIPVVHPLQVKTNEELIEAIQFCKRVANQTTTHG